MSGTLDNMDKNQLDVFREIGNIGSGNAATALAKMLNRQINMSVPDVQIVPFDDIVNILDGPETLVVGIMISISGGLNGYILMILAVNDACELLNIALSDEYRAPGSLSAANITDLDKSALTEIANILVGAYLSAICELSGLRVTPSVPELALDMVGAILSIVAIEYGKIGDSVLFLKTQFSDVDKDMNGDFFLIPDYESYKILLESLGMS